MKKTQTIMKRILCLLALCFLLALLTGCSGQSSLDGGHDVQQAKGQQAALGKGWFEQDDANEAPAQAASITLPDGTVVPSYSGEAYAVIDDNIPGFTSEELQANSFESYSDLDGLGRCGAALACIGQDLMPTEERGNISAVKPSGWQTVKYDHVDGKYLYNRCHLIGFQLTAENANEKNLITGTRYMNVEGMLPFENMAADYIKETGNHVLYRVTPVFTGENLVADGVQMEALSVEDDGDGICFNVFVYNIQPGIAIDYATGESRLGGAEAPAGEDAAQTEETYILNTNSKKFHLPGCSSVETISEEHQSEYTGSREELVADGYSPCGRCKP